MKNQYLRLRSLSLDDISSYYKLVSDKKLAESAAFPPAKNKLQAIFMLKNDLEHTNSYVITFSDDDQMIGIISLYEYIDDDQSPSSYKKIIGYMLNRKYQRKGIMSYSLSMLIKALKIEGHIRELYAEVSENNASSIHVLTNNHFKCYQQFLDLSRDHMDLIYQLNLF